MRVEMNEEMADFWTEVRGCLPGLLKKEGFLSAAPMGNPDELEIFSKWQNGNEEYIATLQRSAEGLFTLVVDTPGTNYGRVFRDVSPTGVVVVIETEVAGQVGKYLPGAERGAWPAYYPFTWNGVFVASFEDGDDKGANLTEFVEYARREADRALFREAMLTVVGLLMREDVTFTTMLLPLYGLGVITLADRTVRLDTDDGCTVVTVADTEGEHKGSVKISMGPNGVSYPYLTMEELIREATGRNR